MSKGITGYSLVFIPRSWAVGIWRKPHKTIFAFGPLRFAHHRSLSQWKQTDHVPGPGQWLHGSSRSEFIGNGFDRRIPAGGAMEPKNYPREREGFHGGARSGQLGFDG